MEAFSYWRAFTVPLTPEEEKTLMASLAINSMNYNANQQGKICLLLQ